MKNYLTTLIIGIAVVIAAFVLGHAYNYKFHQQQAISVTGGAEINFNSDLIVWMGSYSRKAATLESAYAQLKGDEQKVRDYLSQNGIGSGEVIFTSVNIAKNFENKYDSNGRIAGSVFTGYTLTQSVKVQSKEIAKVEKVSREITGLIQSGVEFNSEQPAYYYTKLSDLKIDLLAKAAADGRQRAETIARHAGSSLGALKDADMGVFQITGQYSNEEYTWGGTFNTRNKEKTAAITVKMEFAVK
jgi:hypothetical protein